MAVVFSTYVSDIVLNWLRGTNAPSAPSSLFLEFNTTAPAADGSGGVSPGARQTIAFSAPVLDEELGGMIASTALITLTGASAGTVTHVSIWTASSGGNLIAVLPAAVPQTVSAGGTFTAAAASVRLYVGGLASFYLATNILNWIRGTAMPAAPADVFVAYSRAAPMRAGSGLLEPLTAYGYERQPITFAAPEAAVEGRKIVNDASAVFGPAYAGAWLNVSHIALFDSVDSDDNMLLVGQVNVPFSVGIGSGHGIALGGLTITQK